MRGHLAPFLLRALAAVTVWLVVSCSPLVSGADESGSLHTLKVRVFQGSGTMMSPLANARVTIEGAYQTTGTSGEVTFRLADGNHKVTTTKDGYGPKEASVRIAGDDGVETVALSLTRQSSTTPDTWTPGAGWTLQWADEFSGAVLDTSRWRHQVEPPARFNNELQAYTNSAENAFVTNRSATDGMMVIRAVKTGSAGGRGDFTSARMITHPNGSFQYGKIAARIQLPAGKGLWPAFWMLGSNISENSGGTVDWPFCGEIDILELHGSSPALWTGAFHYANAANVWEYQAGSAVRPASLADDFHVYEMEWSSTSLVWRVDGTQVFQTDISSAAYDEFRKPFYLLLNLAVGGNFDGNPDSTTVFPKAMYVDWVRVYQ